MKGCDCSLKLKLLTLAPLPIDGFQLSQGNRGTMIRQFTFYHALRRSSRKAERKSRPCNPGSLE